MKPVQCLAFVVALCVAQSAAAEETPDPDISKAAKQVIASLLEYFSGEIAGLTQEIPDMLHYEPPVILPNGDILIRRKPAPLPPPEDGEIDL